MQASAFHIRERGEATGLQVKGGWHSFSSIVPALYLLHDSSYRDEAKGQFSLCPMGKLFKEASMARLFPETLHLKGPMKG